jgi:hypothetical protein
MRVALAIDRSAARTWSADAAHVAVRDAPGRPTGRCRTSGACGSAAVDPSRRASGSVPSADAQLAAPRGEAYGVGMDPPPGPARSRLADDPVDGAAAAFMRAVHERFGDPATIRTDWTDEPMVLFSHRDSAIAGRPDLGVSASLRPSRRCAGAAPRANAAAARQPTSPAGSQAACWPRRSPLRIEEEIVDDVDVEYTGVIGAGRRLPEPR